MSINSSDERIFLETPERDQPNENIGLDLVELRDSRTDLTDEEFFIDAGRIIVSEFMIPAMRDALGLNGEEEKAKVFPLMVTITEIADSVTRNMEIVRKGLAK